ncbi:MAG: hypothetical protein AVDCRST_MAG37-1836, partial [uncultured Rubrobacteraceae bacterium]
WRLSGSRRKSRSMPRRSRKLRSDCARERPRAWLRGTRFPLRTPTARRVHWWWTPQPSAWIGWSGSSGGCGVSLCLATPHRD